MAKGGEKEKKGMEKKRPSIIILQRQSTRHGNILTWPSQVGLFIDPPQPGHPFLPASWQGLRSDAWTSEYRTRPQTPYRDTAGE